MHVLGQSTLGIVVLLLLAVLVVVKRAATGSVLGDKPQGNPWIWPVHVFNLFFLLVANPLAGVLLVMRRLDTADPTRVALTDKWLLLGVETGGLILYLMGYALMAWALLSLRRVYQAAGNAPRITDAMVVAGPYRLVRHPMYLSALCISLGLACLVQSLAYVAVFCVYLALIIPLIPVEERGLHKAYGTSYAAYQSRVRALVPIPRSAGSRTGEEGRHD